MTNELVSTSTVDLSRGRFRPESISHFKEVAKNMAWLLDRPIQKCQEDLSRIYGYSGLHELQQVLKTLGAPGPFDPRYNYLSSPFQATVDAHDQTIFFVLFGIPSGYWREHGLPKDRCYLVFEMGLFQEASEHRACFEKIQQFLYYELSDDNRPLIHGWPLGLRSWLASAYTETFDLAKDWQKALPRSKYGSMDMADIRVQRRATGLTRLDTMFQILAKKIRTRKPTGLGKVKFDSFEDDVNGINNGDWERNYLVDWLIDKLPSGNASLTTDQSESIKKFVQRPSRLTASKCDFFKNMKDPAAFRDRWAFESYKAALDSYRPNNKAIFQSSFDDDCIHSIHLFCDTSYSDQFWQLNCTSSKVIDQKSPLRKPALQPLIHTRGSLVQVFDSDLFCMSDTEWFLDHNSSEFANESAADAFQNIYLQSIGVKDLDFLYRDDIYSVVEIDEILIASTVCVDDLKQYFVRFLEHFDHAGNLPDSYGYWSHTLEIRDDDHDENYDRTADGNYADYINKPSVLMISVEGCGITSVQAIHKNGKPVSLFKPDPESTVTKTGEALTSMVLAATKGLPVDVVIYDGS